MRRRRAEPVAVQPQGLALPTAPVQPRLHAVAWLLAAGVMGSAAAQGVGNTPTLRVEPYAEVEQTFTDNVQTNGIGKQADAVTRVRGGLAAQARASRLQGTLNYSLSGLAYARDSRRNTHQNALNADGVLEWYERQGYLKASATISQVANSVFTAQPVVGGLPGNNTSEQRSLRIGPTWTGQVAGLVRVDASAEGRISRLAGPNAALEGNSSGSTLSLRLSPFRPGPLSWAVGLTSQRTSYERSRDTGSDWLFAQATYDWTAHDLRLLATVGHEQSNLASLNTTSKATYGLGATWQPSPRTRVEVRADQRAYGSSYLVQGDYRTPRTTWQVQASRSANLEARPEGLGAGAALFNSYMSLFQALEPDPVLRAVRVLAYLQALGIDPNQLFGTGLLRTAATQDQRQLLSAAWRGLRFQTSLVLSSTQTERLDKTALGADVLDTAGQLRLVSLAWVYDYKLLPDTSLGLLANASRSRAVRTGERASQQGLSVRLSGRWTAKDSWSLGLRHTSFDNLGQPASSENALTASYGIRF